MSGGKRVSSYMSRDFWAGTAERALKTFAQSLLGVLMGGASGLLDVDWVAALSVAGLATVGSVLTSVATPDFTAGVPVPPADELQAEPQAQTRDERLAREAREHGG